MNKNLEYLEKLIQPGDTFGNDYLNLIKKSLKEGRGCTKNYTTAKNKKEKEKILNDNNLSIEYSEIHHIIPVCCGGTNAADNLILLYCTEKHPEHVVAHELLYKSQLFSDYKDQLLASYFKMTFSRNLNSRLSVEEAAKLREDYGKIKSKQLKGISRKTKISVEILYNGKKYVSAGSLESVEINGGFHDHTTILRWAKYGLHGLSLASGKKYIKPAKKERKGVQILYKGKIYKSIRELSKTLNLSRRYISDNIKSSNPDFVLVNETDINKLGKAKKDIMKVLKSIIMEKHIDQFPKCKRLY